MRIALIATLAAACSSHRAHPSSTFDPRQAELERTAWLIDNGQMSDEGKATLLLRVADLALAQAVERSDPEGCAIALGKYEWLQQNAPDHEPDHVQAQLSVAEDHCPD